MIEIPRTDQTSYLSSYQYRLLVSLCQNTGSEGTLKVSIEQLQVWTGNVSEKTVRRALVALEGHGWVSRQSTRRANGFRGVDIYSVHYPENPHPRVAAQTKRLNSSSWDFSEQDLLDKYGTKCHICDEEIDLTVTRQTGLPGWERGLHFDHVVPLSKNGTDTEDNLRPAHALCNLSKGNKILDKNVRTENVHTDNVHTSHDYKSRSHITNKPLVPNSKDSNQLKDIRNTEGVSMKEIRVPMRKWEDDSDNLAGFGLVEERDAVQPKIRKSDPKTRGKRPDHEWTPMDVAAEFSYRVGKRYPLLPGTVNVRQLSGALSKFRKQYQTTALVELELLKLFMADESNFQNIGDEAPHLYKLYLASFGKKMNQARENLGLNKVNAKVDTSVKVSTLTASDGKVFQNSLSGRAQLERYEKRLGATQ